MLPVQQVGSMLFGNQLTEEVPHTLESFSKSDCKKEFLEPSIPSIEPHFTLVLIVDKAFFITIPHNHSTDIYSPPPNC